MCVYLLDPFTRVVQAKGDKEVVKVNTAAGCAWSASSDVSWLQMKGDPSGTGSHDVHYDVDRNRSRVTRFGTITIAGSTHFVVQRGDN